MIQSIQYSIYFLWFATVDLFLFKAVRNYRKRIVVTNVYQKGLDLKDKSKTVYKYFCKLIFTEPTGDFHTNNTSITVELIHVNEKSVKTKLTTLTLDFKDVGISRGICCNKRIFGYFMIIRHKPLPLITFIRGVHQSSKESQIFFKGFEIIDQMSGERTFFAVNTVVINTDLREAVVHSIKPQRLRLFTKQTFCPDFHSVEIEEYGKRIPTPENSSQEVNGIILLPALNWFEVFVFNAFLIHLTFCLMIVIISYLNDINDLQKSMAAVLGSGLISATVTQIVSYSYRSAVKTNYNSNCSPIKVELKELSLFWQMFRSFYLMVFLLTPVLLSLVAIFLISDELIINFGNQKQDVFDQTENLLILFFCSLIVVYILWLPLFVVFRLLFRLMFCTSKRRTEEEDISASNREDFIQKSDKKMNESSPKEQSKPYEDTERSTLSPTSRESKNESRESKAWKESSEKSWQRDKSDTRNRSNYADKWDKEDKEDKDEEKGYSPISRDEELYTGSVIVKPTKSLPFYDPYMFRLTESTLGSDEPKVKSISEKKNK